MIEFKETYSLFVAALALSDVMRDQVTKTGEWYHDTSFWSQCAAESTEHIKDVVRVAGPGAFEITCPSYVLNRHQIQKVGPRVLPGTFDLEYHVPLGTFRIEAYCHNWMGLEAG